MLFGSSIVTETLYLEKDVALNLFKCNIIYFLSTTNSIHIHDNIMAAKNLETDISKPDLTKAAPSACTAKNVDTFINTLNRFVIFKEKVKYLIPPGSKM